MRTTCLATSSHYHIFNRGVDKRDIFLDEYDIERFFFGMKVFNTVQPINSIYEYKRLEKRGSLASICEKPLVKIVCYCLNPNHFHMILEQVEDNGIEKFMHRLGTGYTKYFNNKYKRNGSLFQGPFKSVLIESNEQLLHTSVYVNLNNRGSLASKISKSSWDEYNNSYENTFCKKEIVLSQFKSIEIYRIFAESSYEDILKNKMKRKELQDRSVEA
jgi:REP element-mobilizing transposase RayT